MVPVYVASRFNSRVAVCSDSLQHHTIDAHDVHAASRDMGAMGYSRIFRSGLVSKVEPPSVVSLRGRIARVFPSLSSTLTDLSKTLTTRSRN